MQSNEYGAYDAYDYGVSSNMLVDQPEDDPLMMAAPQQVMARPLDVNFDDPKIASLPRVLLMGPRRGGKTSIQVRGGDLFTAKGVKGIIDFGQYAWN